MDRAEEPDPCSLSEARARTPAYASFEASTDKLLHLLQFIFRGSQSFRDELETKLGPEVMNIATGVAQVGEPQDQEARNSVEKKDDRVQRITDTLINPLNQFIGGLLTVREWVPVLLVTAVEAYLKDVRIYAAKVDPTVLESSEQSASYAEVLRAQSIVELTEELQSRWARNFVDDGGPDRWIKRLTKMGARGYRPETASEMETLWGVRHLIVHSKGVATPEFVRRHPEIGAKVGESILIRSDQLTQWITVVYDFVDVTDFYFVQRYRPEGVSTT